ncbi:MAG: BlaI/MecI/CopY family transcriptional regulator [Lachnospiraceae bacterium]|nr:BlaI/MecI/CopY family transcriptional regulator [Lachnospiraceae bacterium]
MADKNFVDYHLTKRERDVLSILWNSEDGMIASEIKDVREDLTINTVQVILKKLLNRKFIQIQEIVYSGTVLCRKYCPTLSEAEFNVAEITQNIYGLERFGISPMQYLGEFIELSKLTDSQLAELGEVLEGMKKEA